MNKFPEGRDFRILLADEGEVTRFALAALLEQRPGWVIVGEVGSARKLAQKIKLTCPDIILLSGNLPELKIEEMIPTLCKEFPELSVVVLSGRPEMRSQALDAGAFAFVSKVDPPDRLLEAVNSVLELPKQ